MIVTDVDPKLAVHRSNNQNRDATPGQKAMATAMAFPEAAKGGRGNKKRVDLESTLFSEKTLARARYVLRNNPIPEGRDYPQRCLDIMAGSLSLTEAYDLTQADVKWREIEALERAENAAKLADVRIRYPNLAALVDDERLTLAQAIASAEQSDRDAAEEVARLARIAAEKERLAQEEADRLQAEEDAKLAEADREKKEAERLAKETFDRNQMGIHQYLDQLINATCVAVNLTQVDLLEKHLDWDAFASKYRHKRVDALRVLNALSNNLPALIKVVELAP